MKLTILILLLGLCLVACNQSPTSKVSLQPQDFGNSGDISMVDVAANSKGVYAAGYTNGPLGTPNSGGYDAFIRNYNDNGLVWLKQFGTRFYDRAEQIAVDSSGNSYVLGTTGGSLGFKVGGSDSFLQKYDSNGLLQWTRQFGSTLGDSASDVLVDKNGDIYTVSNEKDLTIGVIRKWSSGGTLLFTINATEEPVWENYRRVLAVNTAGILYMLTPYYAEGRFVLRLHKYTSTGASVRGFPKIIYRSGFDKTTLDMKLDSSNNIYMILNAGGRGTGNPGGGTFLRKTNSNGDWQWTKNLEPGPVDLPYAYKTRLSGLAIDANNTIYVSGSTSGTYRGFTRPPNTPDNADVVVFKYDTKGNRLWVQQFVNPEDEGVTGLALSDALYISGNTTRPITNNVNGLPTYYRRDPFLARADLSTGALLGISK